jgi:hypothetical protein
MTIALPAVPAAALEHATAMVSWSMDEGTRGGELVTGIPTIPMRYDFFGLPFYFISLKLDRFNFISPFYSILHVNVFV